MFKRKAVAWSFMLAVIGILIIYNVTIASESESLRLSFWQNFKNNVYRLFIVRPLSEFKFEVQIAKEQAAAVQDLIKKRKLNNKDIENYEKQLERVEAALKKLNSLNSEFYGQVLESFLNQYNLILKSSSKLSDAIEKRLVGIISSLAQINGNDFILRINNSLTNNGFPADELFNAIIINRVALVVPKELLPALANLKQERLLRFWILVEDLDPENLKNQLLKHGQISPTAWLRVIDETRESLSEEVDRSVLNVARQFLFDSLIISVDKNEIDINLKFAEDMNKALSSLMASKEYKNMEQIKELAERSGFNLEQASALEKLGNYGASLSQAILASALSEVAMQKIYLSALDFQGELKIMRQRFDNILPEKKELFPEQARLLENLLVSKDVKRRFADIQKLLIEFELNKVE